MKSNNKSTKNTYTTKTIFLRNIIVFIGLFFMFESVSAQCTGPANDCDGDGVSNSDEIDPDGDGTSGGVGPNGPATDPNNPCDYNVFDVTLTISSGEDCDGDGLTDQEEIDPNNDGDIIDLSTNPFDSDTDGDGTNDADDPNPTVPTANDDNISGKLIVPIIINILANDDYLDNQDPTNEGTTSITLIDGTAAGIISFDPDTGELTYISTAAESGADITVVYRVCNDESGTPVCATATVIISVAEAEAITVENDLVNPNLNDGVFRITNIEAFPNNTVRIYNRWGVLVFETRNYNNAVNAFRGVSDGRATLSQDSELPVGVYFYIIDYINTNEERNTIDGYLYVNR